MPSMSQFFSPKSSSPSKLVRVEIGNASDMTSPLLTIFTSTLKFLMTAGTV